MVKRQSKYDVAIIADGNSEIGMGHIMRCSAIADALQSIGFSSLFITSDEEAEAQIAELGYDSECLHSDYRLLAEQDEGIIDCLKSKCVSFAFFDSYYSSNSLFEAVSREVPVGCFGYGKKYFQGMQLIVPYGISSDRQWYDSSFDAEKTQVLFGSQYVPLKKAFWSTPKKNMNKKPERLLLTSGGTDPLGITQALVKKIRSTGNEIALDIVVGQFYDVKALKTACDDILNISFHEGMTDLSRIMSEASLSISAGGMTLYELMASSVPTIAYAFVDNQLGNSLLDGGVVWCGDIRKNGNIDETAVVNIVTKLNNLMISPEDCKQLVERGRSICDGHGAERIAKAIKDFIIS